MPGPGICITVNLTLKPEHADEVCDQLAVMVQDTRNFVGFRNVEIARRQDDPTKLIFIEHWDNAEAYEKYVSWRTDRGEMDALIAKMTSPPEISFWPIQVVEADGPSKSQSAASGRG